MRQIFLDTETTGLSALGGDRIVEFAAIEMIDRKVTGKSLHLYFNPQMKMPKEAFDVHGLDDAFLADKPLFADHADEILDFMADTSSIAHNAPFDEGFLSAELKRAKRMSLAERHATMECSMAMAQLILGKRMSLDSLVKHFKIPNSRKANAGLHGGMLDATLLSRLYLPLTSQQSSFLESAVDVEVVKAPSALSSYELPVIYANEDEIEADRLYSEALAKSSRPKG